MQVIGIIPARYKSSRFPGKPLVKILGKPLILWVCEGAAAAIGRENLVVATEDERIVQEVETAGFRAMMTSDEHLTGTDRLAEVAGRIESEIYINIQGDEPLVRKDDILHVVEEKKLLGHGVINAYAPLSIDEDPANVNIPKVLINENNKLVYLSRLPIPGMKNVTKNKPVYLKQVCIYGFSRHELFAFRDFGRKGSFESFEDIEILRFFELGIPIHMVRAYGNYQAVDIPEDVQQVEKLLKLKGYAK